MVLSGMAERSVDVVAGSTHEQMILVPEQFCTVFQPPL
jgi:hypothetical protein